MGEGGGEGLRLRDLGHGVVLTVLRTALSVGVITSVGRGEGFVVRRSVGSRGRL